ncbi:unnamed protein product [Fusarium graminearum]|nr:unnamed protein product [Fusarium graminearum]
MISSVAPGDYPHSDRSSGYAASETRRPMPRSLGEALRAVGTTLDTPGSETPSEEDYEENVRPTLAEPSTVRNRHPYARHGRPMPDTLPASPSAVEPESRFKHRDSGVYIVSDEDNSLQQLLMTSSQWSEESSSPKIRRRKFADLVFTRQFSAFDRHNPSAFNSPFHGFYTLFWLAVFLFVLKISVQNWQIYGNPLGTSDIMKTMFHRDVYKQRATIIKKLKQLDLVDPTMTPSQTEPPASAISTHHLSVAPSAEERRKSISAQSEKEESDIEKISRAIASHEPLDDQQIALFERIMKWEIDAMSDELRGTAFTPDKAYPNNLSFVDHYKWIPLPTLVYEIEYPRSDSIDWSYVLEKAVAMVGILFVMVQVSQYSMYPVVMKTVEMKENDVPLIGRLQEFPGLLLDLIFPFMMEYLLVWYLIWETILNILAELTYFADRSFYDAWWNSVSWDQFARDWNRPVHVFLLRHVYHSSISSLKVNKHTATLITFFLSACVHELVMWCLFKKLRGYLLFLQMCQLPHNIGEIYVL